MGKPLTNERVLYRAEVILIRWLPLPPRSNFNAATGSFFNWIFNWDGSRYINTSSARATLCVYCYYYSQRSLVLRPSSLFFSRRFSLGAAFFTADYICGYTTVLSSFSFGQFPSVVYERALKCSTFFSPELNNLQTSHFFLCLYPLIMYTQFPR